MWSVVGYRVVSVLTELSVGSPHFFTTVIFDVAYVQISRKQTGFNTFIIMFIDIICCFTTLPPCCVIKTQITLMHIHVPIYIYIYMGA